MLEFQRKEATLTDPSSQTEDSWYRFDGVQLAAEGKVPGLTAGDEVAGVDASVSSDSDQHAEEVQKYLAQLRDQYDITLRRGDAMIPALEGQSYDTYTELSHLSLKEVKTELDYLHSLEAVTNDQFAEMYQMLLTNATQDFLQNVDNNYLDMKGLNLSKDEMRQRFVANEFANFKEQAEGLNLNMLVVDYRSLQNDFIRANTPVDPYKELNWIFREADADGLEMARQIDQSTDNPVWKAVQSGGFWGANNFHALMTAIKDEPLQLVASTLEGGLNLLDDPVDVAGDVLSAGYGNSRKTIDAVMAGNYAEAAYYAAPVVSAVTPLVTSKAGTGLVRKAGSSVVDIAKNYRLELSPGTLGMNGGGVKVVANSSNRNLNISEFITDNGVVKQTATKGDVFVNLSKIEVYARGKSQPFTDELQQELRGLNAFKQADRKVFDSDPSNAARLKKLNDLKKNYQRSQEMSATLESVGLFDNVTNNDLIINHILDVGQNINSSNQVQYPSILKGPDGDLKVLSTFGIFDDGNKYLSTINFIPMTK